MPLHMFEKLLVSIAKQFDKHNIPYIIIGGQAVLLYGEPRLTKDIDITIGLNIDMVDKIVKIMQDISLKPLPEDLHQQENPGKKQKRRYQIYKKAIKNSFL